MAAAKESGLEFLVSLFGVSGMVDSLSFLFFVRSDLPDFISLCARAASGCAPAEAAERQFRRECVAMFLKKWQPTVSCLEVVEVEYVLGLERLCVRMRHTCSCDV